MAPSEHRYILTVACPDVRGIVSAVSTFISEFDGFIIESAQFGDPSTQRFFLRMEFNSGPNTPDFAQLKDSFNSRIADKFNMQWNLTNKANKSRVLIMVSKESHCLSDLIYRVETGTMPMEIAAIASNHKDLEHIAKRHAIPYHHFSMDQGKERQEQQILNLTKEQDIDLVVLARYMQILSDSLCTQLKGRAINIHHSFLPSFKGAKPYNQAYNRGVKLIGATAHYVTCDLDEGPIIEQEVARVDHSKTPAELTAIGRDIEKVTLARAVKYHLEHRVLLNGKKTVIFR